MECVVFVRVRACLCTFVCMCACVRGCARVDYHARVPETKAMRAASARSSKLVHQKIKPLLAAHVPLPGQVVGVSNQQQGGRRGGLPAHDDLHVNSEEQQRALT